MENLHGIMGLRHD